MSLAITRICFSKRSLTSGRKLRGSPRIRAQCGNAFLVPSVSLVTDTTSTSAGSMRRKTKVWRLVTKVRAAIGISLPECAPYYPYSSPQDHRKHPLDDCKSKTDREGSKRSTYSDRRTYIGLRLWRRGHLPGRQELPDQRGDDGEAPCGAPQEHAGCLGHQNETA